MTHRLDHNWPLAPPPVGAAIAHADALRPYSAPFNIIVHSTAAQEACNPAGIDVGFGSKADISA
ncbi:MAG: hypothetical protein ACJ8EY_09510 [Sphingomicrobium sp.]